MCSVATILGSANSCIQLLLHATIQKTVHGRVTLVQPGSVHEA